MIRYVIDSSALWRLLRERTVREEWTPIVAAGAVGSCHPQRAEFRRSARSLREYDEMRHMFDVQYPDLPVPKTAWTWLESAQYRLIGAGGHRAASVTDLLVCAVAAHHGAVVLHDDLDYRLIARLLPDLAERSIRDLPRADG